MTVTMTLSGLLCLSIAGLIWLATALARSNDRLRRAHKTLDAHESKLVSVMLPELVLRPVTGEPEYEGWVEVDVGDHSDALRFVMRMTDGESAEHGKRIVRALQCLAVSMRWENPS